MSNKPFVLDENLLQFATKRQAEHLLSWAKHGSANKAAKAENIHDSMYRHSLRAVKKKAAKAGYAPDADMTVIAPDPFYTKGVSSYYSVNPKTGEKELKGQWHKTKIDEAVRAQMIQDAISELVQDVPKAKKRKPPKKTQGHLLNVYTMTDCHMGMLAWGEECGEDWDLNIAEATLTGCFRQMLLSSPQAESCVVAQLGDFLHYDSMVPTTPTSGHILDSDTRFPKLVAAAVRVLRSLVDMALKFHKTVHVLMAEGNHDIASSIWLRTLFAAIYENEPRVIMIESHTPYYALQHGSTMVGWHHGHKKGLTPDTGLMFAQRNAKMFGDTSHRYIHFGDKHHWAGKEVAGFYLEQHPTLAAKDAYAARGGWDSHSRASAITYHENHGEVSRVTVSPGMLA